MWPGNAGQSQVLMVLPVLIQCQWWDYGGIEVKYNLPNAKLLGRKIGGSWGPESERGAAYREKKRMMENHGLCGYFQAVVRSEQHFLSVRTGLAVEAAWVCLHLPLGAVAASVLSALLLPAVSLQTEKEVTFLSPFTVVFWKGCFCCRLLFFYNQEAVTATVDL